eukprot:c24000_g1_i3 orf=713-2032(+)
MSVAYQSWEVASGPTMGFKMAIQSNMCAVSDVLVSDVPNYMINAHSSPEPFTKTGLGGSDGLKGLTFPNHIVLPPQDTVIRGFSSLSLQPQSQLEANSPSEDRRSMPVCKSSSKSLEFSHHAVVAGNESISCGFAARPAGHLVQGTFLDSQQSSTTFDQNLMPHYMISRVGSVNVVSTGTAFLPNPCTLGARNSTRARGMGMPWTLSPPSEDHGDGGLYGFSSTHHSPKRTLDVVAEDKPWEEGSSVTMCDQSELDTLSTSSTDSFSSLHDEPVEVSSSSGEGLFGVGEAEVQSEFKGPSSFSVGFSPPRKGLSRFYAGKSRSFSCLADVVSLKDLAKPESPYAKKRKCNVGRSSNASRPQLPPLQKGAASISKKSVYNGKSTLALAVAMSTREDVLSVEDNGTQKFVGVQRCQSSPLTSRSYSLSDLQGVTGSHISPC